MTKFAKSQVRNGAAGILAAILAAFAAPPAAEAAEANQRLPLPALDEPAAAGPETAVFAGGCFWGIQAVFQHTEGVIDAVSGYSGGAAATARYQIVGTGTTGHAEAVQVTYDPAKISYGRLLQVFFSVGLDPTQVDRQGPDFGSQYRSELFATTDAQRRVAAAYIAQLDAAKVFPRPIATKVSRLEAFYPAEDYHQDYATLHPESLYILINDRPKVVALERLFPETYRVKPILVKDAAKK